MTLQYPSGYSAPLIAREKPLPDGLTGASIALRYLCEDAGQAPPRRALMQRRAQVNRGAFAERSRLLMENEPQLSCVVTAGVLEPETRGHFCRTTRNVALVWLPAD